MSATAKVSPEKIQSTLMFLLPMLEMGVKYTPTNVDDRVVQFIKPILLSPHFAPFLAEIMDAFDGKTPSIQDVVTFLDKHKGGVK